MSSSRRPKRLALLGATGSVGGQVRDLVRRHPEHFSLHALIGGHDANALQLAAQAHPDAHVLLAEPAGGDRAQAMSAIERVVTDPEVDLVVVAVSGSAALPPTLAALRAGKDIALATKEVLVMAGELVREEMRRHGSRIFPVDSEHSAIWQCLWGERQEAVRRLILTGSGGPFLRRPLPTLARVTVAEALAHPRWKMGPKITVDSATMMNKGLEVLEAHVLFDIAFQDIDVVVHPQSVVHSMVQFTDGSVKAQLAVPDMHLPIAIALGYPDRIPGVVEAPDLAAIGQLTFEALDEQRFPAVALAREAGERGGTAPAVLNAANEQAVALFLQEQIVFTDIVALVRRAVAEAPAAGPMSLDSLLSADRWARARVLELAQEGSPRTSSKVRS
jgi:1-deoxy-D-xylulose-5-phosphate reductoisomerase